MLLSRNLKPLHGSHGSHQFGVVLHSLRLRATNKVLQVATRQSKDELAPAFADSIDSCFSVRIQILLVNQVKMHFYNIIIRTI